ncbi:MAG: hypothetical protein MO852_06325 [Candidatus Devosia euplotis]|nr:hypothetical protein [Candidatus Devosia euplotis]
MLVLLSLGLLFDAATGPSKIVMMMAGHERAYVAIFGVIMMLGFLSQILIISLYGWLAPQRPIWAPASWPSSPLPCGAACASAWTPASWALRPSSMPKIARRAEHTVPESTAMLDPHAVRD